MTKGELRKARKQAVATGRHYTQTDAAMEVAAADAGYSSLPGAAEDRRTSEAATHRRKLVTKPTSKAEQRARYLDCGPANWDDR